MSICYDNFYFKQIFNNVRYLKRLKTMQVLVG
nr:MAG TPA: hypothetical protein [Caudoviricetes sp.]